MPFTHHRTGAPLFIVLPPSETKRLGGTLHPVMLDFEPALHDARVAVREALVELSRDAEAAASALKLGPKNRGESALNLALDEPQTLPAIERYTGVLYDALDLSSLENAEREWLAAHVGVQSALFGLIGAQNHIPAYRLSAGTRLPRLGASLKQVWREAHAGIDWASFEFVLDLRSRGYADLAPIPNAIEVHVAQKGPDGTLRALNHFNKAAKGDLVRRLALAEAQFSSPESLCEWATDTGLGLTAGPGRRQLTLITELGAPAQVGAR